MPDFSSSLVSAPSFGIYLAYDGSINSDWVARYAINMADNNKTRKINLVHVDDGIYSREVIAEKIRAIETESAFREVALEVITRPFSTDVFASLLEAVPHGEATLCICGARTTSRGRGYLAGTISEKLLRSKRFNVFAIRVVKPGILGLPREILFPLSGHPRGLNAAMSLFFLMAPQVTKIYLLRVMQARSLWFRYMSAHRASSIRETGNFYLDRVLEDLRSSFAGSGLFVDGKVVLSDDWVKEILIYANRVRAQMIIMGASDRNLPSRYFYGNKIEQVLRHSPCDVAIYRKI